jgi:hypothetical protein
MCAMCVCACVRVSRTCIIQQHWPFWSIVRWKIVNDCKHECCAIAYLVVTLNIPPAYARQKRVNHPHPLREAQIKCINTISVDKKFRVWAGVERVLLFIQHDIVLGPGKQTNVLSQFSGAATCCFVFCRSSVPAARCSSILPALPPLWCGECHRCRCRAPRKHHELYYTRGSPISTQPSRNLSQGARYTFPCSTDYQPCTSF